MANAAILMMFATLASAITGMFRDVAISHVYGTSVVADAFYNAATIPDFLYFLVAGGALRTGFVPVFTELMAQGENDRAWRMFSAIFWMLSGLAALLAGAGILLAEPLAAFVNPSWAGTAGGGLPGLLETLGLMQPGEVTQGNPEALAICALIMKLMFPAQIFFLLGGLLMGALNARKHFFWPAMGPIIYNIAIIAAALLAPVLFGPTTLGLGVLVGAAVGNFGVQIVALRNRGGKFLPFLKPTPAVRRVVLLALPVMLGLAIAEINFAVTKILANAVEGEGGVSTLNYANRLWKLPARVIGAGIAIALFPALAEHYAKGASEQFQRDFSFGMRNAVFLTLPAAALMMVVARPVSGLLFGLDPAGTQEVAVTLWWFSIGIVPLSIVYIAARAFYARHDTMTPVWIGAISVIVCVGSALWLAGLYGVPGLAMATTLAGIINAAGLVVLLQMRIGGLGGREIAASILRLMVPTAIMTTLAWGSLWGLREYMQVTASDSRLAALLLVVIPMALGTLSFIGIAKAMRLRELESAWRMVARKVGRGRK